MGGRLKVFAAVIGATLPNAARGGWILPAPQLKFSIGENMDSTSDVFNLEKLIGAMNGLPRLKPIIFKPAWYWYDEVVTQTRKFKSKKKRFLKKFKKNYMKVERVPRKYVVIFDNPDDGKIYIIGSYEQIERIERIYYEPTINLPTPANR